MNEPHSHPRYYGELLKAYRSRLFIDGHKPAPYYASGVARIALERLFNSVGLERRLRVYRHHMLMLLRMQIAGPNMPSLGSDKITSYSLRIVETLRKDDRFRQECERAIRLIEGTLSGFDVSGLSPRDRRTNTPDRRREFTRKILESFESERPKHAEPRSPNAMPSVLGPRVGDEETGRIRLYDDWKNFGFIERDSGGSIFVHAGELTKVPWHLRQLRTRVRYEVIPGREKMPMAGNVRLAEIQ